MELNPKVNHTKKDLKALYKSRVHWGKMIEWAKTQQKEDYADPITMKTKIKQNWGADYCALCKIHHKYKCKKCPFKFYENECEVLSSAWYMVSASATWQCWIENAYKMLEKINQIISIYETALGVKNAAKQTNR